MALRQVSTIIETRFLEHGTLVAHVKDLLESQGIPQYAVAYREGEWVLSYPGTKIIREPSPKRGRKTA